jgi:hypothetical protein
LCFGLKRYIQAVILETSSNSTFLLSEPFNVQSSQPRASHGGEALDAGLLGCDWTCFTVIHHTRCLQLRMVKRYKSEVPNPRPAGVFSADRVHFL